jgi:hypothetical protein
LTIFNGYDVGAALESIKPQGKAKSLYAFNPRSWKMKHIIALLIFLLKERKIQITTGSLHLRSD